MNVAELQKYVLLIITQQRIYLDLSHFDEFVFYILVGN